MKKEIAEGEEQPVPCVRCGDSMGYQYSETIIKNYVYMFTPEGESDGGFWGEFGKRIYVSKTAYCSNCGGKLDFKIKQS